MESIELGISIHHPYSNRSILLYLYSLLELHFGWQMLTSIEANDCFNLRIQNNILFTHCACKIVNFYKNNGRVEIYCENYCNGKTPLLKVHFFDFGCKFQLSSLYTEFINDNNLKRDLFAKLERAHDLFHGIK